MSNLVRLALAIREGGMVERMHTVPHHSSHNNAEHQWNMAMLLFTLHPDPSMTLVRAVLEHDIAERWTGDTPGPAKHWINPELGKVLKETERDIQRRLGLDSETIITKEERCWLKGLDQLEFMMFCEDELNMGNKHVRGALNNVMALIQEIWDDLPKEISDFIRDYKWERTNDMFDLEPLHTEKIEE